MFFWGALTSVGALFIFERKNEMEEKIIIKSRMNQAVKNFLKFTPIVCFAVAAIISILFSIPTVKEDKYHTYIDLGWIKVFDDNPEHIIYSVLLVIGSICLLVSIVVGFIYLINRNCELEITESSVKGRALFGKEVVLPLDMVSAYSTRRFLSVVAVATSSGITKFALIENYKEIGDVLSQLIHQRQKSTQVDSTQSSPKSDSFDELVKLKSLLDSGIITEEEFELKKKQLLGL